MTEQLSAYPTMPMAFGTRRTFYSRTEPGAPIPPGAQPGDEWQSASGKYLMDDDGKWVRVSW